MDVDVTDLIVPGEANHFTLRVLCNSDTFGANGIYECMFLYAAVTDLEQTTAFLPLRHHDALR